MMILYSAITPKSEDKYVVKVFNRSEFHLSEMTLLQNPYLKYSSADLGVDFKIVQGCLQQNFNKNFFACWSIFLYF